MTTDDKPGWYSISVEYELIPEELRPGRGEWYLHATLVHEFRDSSGGIQTEKTPLGSIDVDHIDRSNCGRHSTRQLTTRLTR